MSGGANEDCAAVGRSSLSEDMSSGQRCQSSDSLAEWRSSEQVENGTPSTSPPYWDTDDDDDIGPKPSELYGKFTWKIENFSQISKRELRSNAFEVGGYKWYILIYPQGCDVCNHLSLFLCVANHDKLLPGWSHFAQFTIAVVNKDPKKSKYSDTLHRFWKKEHDWGWKKFMELSKVLDGFIVNDILVIKAQVQVIREKTHRPFRCLDCQYRRELVRVYLSNVEQICRRYIEERRGKLSKLIEDRVRWSSFRAFWSGVDKTSRLCMSSDKADAILKVVVKHFFIEKEVTSTLVMDSLYSGLKALESQSKNNKGKEISAEIEEMPAPIVCVDKDMFILADDVLVLLERAAAEPLPPKDDKASQSQNTNQNRTKEGNSGDEFNRDSIERDERRLTELGRRTVEIFVLAHIFSSRIEVAYQEAVALKRQEELIREEEASWLAEEKAKRGTAEKEKRSKKKQGKQKRSGRKGKDKAKDEKSDVTVQGKSKKQSSPDDRQTEQFLMKPAETVLEKLEISEDVSDVSDNGDDVNEVLQPDLEERDACPRDWDTDTSEIPPVTEASSSEIPSEQTEMTNASVVDDSSSTCSTDSVPSVGINGQYRGKSLQTNNMNGSSSRGKNKRGKVAPSRTSHAHNERGTLPSDASTEAGSSSVANDVVKNGAPDFATVPPLKGRRHNFEQNLLEKQNEVVSVQKKSGAKNEVDLERPTKPVTTQSSSTPASPIKTVQLSLQQPARINVRDAPSNHRQNEKPVSAATRPLQAPSPTKPDLQKLTVATKLTSNQMPIVSRPSSAPLVPAPRPTAPAPTIQTVPMLSRSVSAAGRIGTTDPLPTSHSYGPQSYRNAIIGKNTMASSSNIFPRPTSNSSSQAGPCSQTTAPVVPSTSSAAQNSTNGDRNSGRSGFEQLSAVPEAHTNESRWAENCSPLGAIGSNILHTSNIIGGTASLGLQNGNSRHAEVVSSISIRAASASAPDEFPHLDLINYLLDEDPNTEKMEESKVMQHLMNREFTFSGSSSLATDPCLSNGSYQFEAPSQYYDEALQRVFYSSGGGSFSGRRDPLSPQLDTSAYGNSHIDSMLPSQWPLADHSLNMDPAEIHGYPYQLPDYTNLSRAFNTYSMYRPSNGR